MNVINPFNPPGRRPMPLALAPDIGRRLATARGELAELNAQHGALALKVTVGSASASDATDFDAINIKLEKVRSHVATLEAAHTAALRQDEETVRAQRASLQRTQINALRKHLEARDQAATRLSDLIGKFAVEYRKLIEHSEKAVAACPIGYEWPDGVALCIPDEIKVVVGAEFWRVADVKNPHEYPNGTHPLAPPGAAADNADYIGYPTRTPPLTERIARATRAILARLELPRAK